jgi:cell division transport system permease protein
VPDSNSSDPGTLQLGDGELHAGAWAARHLQSLLSALGRLSRAPLASLMTTAVIGMALALPAAMVLTLDNLTQVSGRWQGGAELSVFMTASANEETTRRVAQGLQLRPDVASVEVISPLQGLAEYRALGADPAVLAALGDTNPMPWFVVMRIRENGAAPVEVEALASELAQDPMVEYIEYDLRWLNRLVAIMDVARRVAVIMAVMLALGVLLVTGNTIRLEIEHRRAEIQVLQVIGATNAFIRRPFLYTGIWYGLAGALIAAVILAAALLALEGPTERLALTYESSLRLLWPTTAEGLSLVVAGVLLGLTGAWVAVSRYLVGVEDIAGPDL